MQNVNVALHQKCPLCESVGKSVAGIVASETTRGSFGGSGVGIGSDGLVFGGISGTRTSRSVLAESFAPPSAKASHRATGLAIGAGFTIMAGLFYWQIGIPMLLSMDSGGSGPEQNMSQMVTFVGAILPFFLFSVGGFKVYQAWKSSTSKADAKAYRDAQAIDQAREAKYQQLRYCDNDHIVFDPASGHYSQADALGIEALLTKVG